MTSSNWARLTNSLKLFKPNKPASQLSFSGFKILRWFKIIDYTLQYNLYLKIIHFISPTFYKDGYLVCTYVVILTEAKSFTSGTVLASLYISVKPDC